MAVSLEQVDRYVQYNSKMRYGILTFGMAEYDV